MRSSMEAVQEYKVKIEKIINQLPISKVEELFDYADYLGSRYPKKNKSGVDEESLILQQESLKDIWDNPEEDIYEL
jgi:hypothetical protein